MSEFSNGYFPKRSAGAIVSIRASAESRPDADAVSVIAPGFIIERIATRAFRTKILRLRFDDLIFAAR
jgi:hypothetical protein